MVVVVVVAMPGCAAPVEGTAGAAGLVRAIVEALSDCHLAVMGYGPTVIQSILRWVRILKNIR